MRSSMSALWLVAALTTTAVAADKPNFSGNWTLNLEKSNFGPLPMPTSSTLTITHAEPSVTMVADVKGGFGGDEHSEHIYVTDGTPLSFESQGAAIKSALSWDGNALVFHNDIVTPEGFTLSSKATTTLVEGGKTIRQVIHVDAPEPVGAIDMLYVFDRK